MQYRLTISSGRNVAKFLPITCDTYCYVWKSLAEESEMNMSNIGETVETISKCMYRMYRNVCIEYIEFKEHTFSSRLFVENNKKLSKR